MSVMYEMTKINHAWFLRWLCRASSRCVSSLTELSFSLLRSSIQCIRGARSAAGRPSRDITLPVDLMVSEAGLHS